jgi:arylsulfatase A-like enzyme
LESENAAKKDEELMGHSTPAIQQLGNSDQNRAWRHASALFRRPPGTAILILFSGLWIQMFGESDSLLGAPENAGQEVSINGQRDATKHVSSDERKPNIVLILADDLGFGDLGCYENVANRTPHLDQLAQEGLRFTDFHANGPVCSPTRAALLTGRYQQRVGIENPLDIDVAGLPHSTITVAEELRMAGYWTGIFGKWHLGNLEKSNPIFHGFDEFRGHLTSATDYQSHIDRNGNYDWWQNEYRVDAPGYNTELITKDAVRFIIEHRDRPFFLYVSHSAIHFPWMNPEDTAYRVEGKDYNNLTKLGPRGTDEDVRPVVKTMIEAVDASVGQIVDTLRKYGLSEQTLVFFTSDNGGYIHYQGNHRHQISSNGPFRGQKGDVFEGGHRVPAIAVWPGRIRRGQVTDSLALTMDLMPTFLNLAGLNSSDLDNPQTLDGRDLSAVLFNGSEQPAREPVYWRKGDQAAARSGYWKLIRIKNQSPALYNLKNDPGESNDLAAENPEIVKELLIGLTAWERDMDFSYAELTR